MVLLVRLLHRIAVWITIVSSTVLFGVPAMFAALLPPRGDWFTLFARGWARTILFVTGVRLTVLHRERLAPGESFVIVANHSSMADILVLFAGLPVQIRFMAKRSVFRVPFLGWGIAAAGFISVDRGDSVRGRLAVDVALKRLCGGRSVVVFPEETRSPDGELLAFKKGAALVAVRAGLPILPIAIVGTSRVLPRGSLRASPGTVVLAVGEEIPTQGKTASDRAELTQAAREAIERLRQEGFSLLSSRA
ncbi:MAG: lysophospholipid acyltransferase family protein [Thermoanaerobaculia bacterium]